MNTWELRKETFYHRWVGDENDDDDDDSFVFLRISLLFLERLFELLCDQPDGSH